MNIFVINYKFGEIPFNITKSVLIKAVYLIHSLNKGVPSSKTKYSSVSYIVQVL